MKTRGQQNDERVLEEKKFLLEAASYKLRLTESYSLWSPYDPAGGLATCGDHNPDMRLRQWLCFCTTVFLAQELAHAKNPMQHGTKSPAIDEKFRM